MNVDAFARGGVGWGVKTISQRQTVEVESKTRAETAAFNWRWGSHIGVLYLPH